MLRREYVASLGVGCSSFIAGCPAGGPNYRLESFQLPESLTSGDTATASVSLVSDDRADINTAVIVEIGDLREKHRTTVDSGETRTVDIDVDVDIDPGPYEATVEAVGANNELSQQVEVVEPETTETEQ